MKMKLVSAYGTAEIESWLEKPAEHLCGQREGIRGSRRGHEGLLVGKAAKRQLGFAGTSLLSLQTELRQDARKEFWIAVILWAASWGAVALLCA
jgi:hypothetical protein